MEQSLGVRRTGSAPSHAAEGKGRGRSLLDWESAAVLGGAWGAVEVTLGTFLHGIRVPGVGFLMAWLQAAFLVAASRALGRRGLALGAGLVAAAIRFVMPAGALFGPALAVAAQGAAVEAGLLLPGPAGAALAGGLALSWTFLQAAAMGLVVYGAPMATLYTFALRRMAWAVGSGEASAGLALLVGLVLVAGAAAGLVGAKLGAMVQELPLAKVRAEAVSWAMDSSREVPSSHEPAPGPPTWWVWLPVAGATAALVLGRMALFLPGVGLSLLAAASWNRAVLRRLWAPRLCVLAVAVASGAAMVSGVLGRAGWMGLGSSVAVLLGRVVHLTLLGLLAEAWARGRSMEGLLGRLGRFGEAVARAWRILPDAAGWLARERPRGWTRWRAASRFAVAFLGFAVARAGSGLREAHRGLGARAAEEATVS